MGIEINEYDIQCKIKRFTSWRDVRPFLNKFERIALPESCAEMVSDYLKVQKKISILEDREMIDDLVDELELISKRNKSEVERNIEALNEAYPRSIIENEFCAPYLYPLLKNMNPSDSISVEIQSTDIEGNILKEVERETIRIVLEECNSLTEASAKLGINTTNLAKKIVTYKLYGFFDKENTCEA